MKDSISSSAKITLLTSSGRVVDGQDLLLNHLNSVLEMLVEERHSVGFGVDITLNEYPWVFAPFGAFGCNGVTIKLYRSALRGDLLHSDEVEIQFAANLNSLQQSNEEPSDEEGCVCSSSAVDKPSRVEARCCSGTVDIAPARKRGRVCLAAEDRCNGGHENSGHEGHTCWCGIMYSSDTMAEYRCHQIPYDVAEQERRRASAEHAWLLKQSRVIRHELFEVFCCLAWRRAAVALDIKDL